MEKLFCYDLETTGVLPNRHGIHQISGAIVIGGDVKEEFDFKVRPNPKAQIEQAALDVGGVTKEQILAYPDMKIVYRQLIKMLEKYVGRYNKTDKFHLLGYNNTAFDNAFFRAWFLQNEDKYFGSWFWADSWDAMVFASFALKEERSRMENFKLSTVAGKMGIPVDEEKLHDATYDIYLTRKVFERAIEIIKF